MGEVYLSWDGICSHHPNRWVLIARPCDARRADVLGGWVLAHSEEEHEVVLAMDLAPIAHDLALVHTDPELAADTPDFVYTLELPDVAAGLPRRRDRVVRTRPARATPQAVVAVLAVVPR